MLTISSVTASGAVTDENLCDSRLINYTNPRNVSIILTPRRCLCILLRYSVLTAYICVVLHSFNEINIQYKINVTQHEYITI